MEHCCSPNGVTSISVRPYYTMLSHVYLALAMGFLVIICNVQELASKFNASFCDAGSYVTVMMDTGAREMSEEPGQIAFQNV